MRSSLSERWLRNRESFWSAQFLEVRAMGQDVEDFVKKSVGDIEAQQHLIWTKVASSSGLNLSYYTSA